MKFRVIARFWLVLWMYVIMQNRTSLPWEMDSPYIFAIYDLFASP